MKRLSKTTRLTIELNELHRKQLQEHPKIAEEALMQFIRAVLIIRQYSHPKDLFGTRKK